MCRVEVSKTAQRQLKKLDDSLRIALSDAINELAINPRPTGVTN
jgi:mRNA-degrading endonuclease RelE of RelBE toxin-antitoxin system